MKILLFIFLFTLSIFGNNLPKGYIDLKDTLYQEVNRLFPEFYVPPYFGALIEHESCITLKHSKCWNPESRLKTSREEGAGLPQLTRAYHADGSIRFDTLTDLVRKYPKELNGLNWNTVYQRPDLQIRAMILLWKSNFRLFQNKGIDYWNMMAMADASYNAGYGNISNDIQVCKLKANCDPKIWWGNVNTTCTRKKILYDNRSACDIQKHHVNDVLLNKLDKYVISWTEGNYISKYKIKID